MARLADIDKLLEKQFFSLDDDGYGMMVVSVTDIISAPTVEQKKGHWIHDINNLYGCSECMERETMSPKKLKSYCPNCGADMRGDGDG